MKKISRDYMTIQDELFNDLTIDELYEQAKRHQEQKALTFPDLKANVRAILDRVPDRDVPVWDERNAEKLFVEGGHSHVE